MVPQLATAWLLDRMPENGNGARAGAESENDDHAEKLIVSEESPTISKASSLAEPVVIARFWANRRGEAIFVAAEGKSA